MKNKLPWRLYTLFLALSVMLVVIVSLAYWYVDLGHNPVEKLPLLHGVEVEQVVKELGQPDYEYECAMSEATSEFRCELMNTYPLNREGSAQVRIREFHWKHTPYSVVVWFHKIGGKWIALDSVRWKKGIEF